MSNKVIDGIVIGAMLLFLILSIFGVDTSTGAWAIALAWFFNYRGEREARLARESNELSKVLYECLRKSI